MPAPAPYLLLPGTARQALTHYQEIFGGELMLGEYGEMGRTDGPADAIGHGMLRGPVVLFAADAGPDEKPLHLDGLMLALLGHADAETLRRWFDGLADGGQVKDPLQKRPWGDYDGQVVDAYGVRWLIGFQDPGPDSDAEQRSPEGA